jgi:hypothetical protein
MNHRLLFIIGLALATFAAALGVRVAISPSDDQNPEPAAVTGPQSRPLRPSIGGIGRDEPPHFRAAGPPRDATARNPSTITLPDGADPHLIERAAAVQNHADRELERLSRRLKLSESQRARLFPILAAGSASHHPAMHVPGLTAADAARVRNGELGIDDILTPVQQDERIAAELDDDALWREIFENLKRQLEAATPQQPVEPPATEPTHGRRNLNEWMDP